MTEVDLIIRNGLILCCDEGFAAVDRGYIAVSNGLIVGLGREPAMGFNASETIDAAGALVHPGLINAHSHLAWGLLRCITGSNVSEGASFRGYEVPLVAAVSSNDEYVGTVLAGLEALRCGVTAHGDTGSAVHGVTSVARGLEYVGARGSVTPFAADQIREMPRANLSVADVMKAYDRSFGLYPALSVDRWSVAGLLGGTATSFELMAEAAEYAELASANVMLHLLFNSHEREQFLRMDGVSPLVTMESKGILSPRMSLVHMNAADDEDLEVLRRSGASVVHCPSASRMYGLGGQAPPMFTRMLRGGVPVALGTDSCLFPNNWDLFKEIYLACFIARDGTSHPLEAREALQMATLHGARAIGRADELGSLEVGKRADIVIHDTRTFGRPLNAQRAAETLVFSAGSRTVKTVLVDGQTLLLDGRHTSIDEEALLELAEDTAGAWLGRAGLSNDVKTLRG